MRPRHGVVLAVHFMRALTNPFDLGMRFAKAADINGPKIKRRFTPCNPLGQRLPRATSSRNAKSIKACSDIKAGKLRRLTQDKVAIRRKTFRTVEQLLDTGMGKGGNPR